ncbi:B12-binding domain-containing radical SAM protein [Spirochaeta isovalerica]|uniref:Fe-S oxidoreductase n=1 Tax=Spirochaeta isovalerica TaxID=150 RepID=A0A841RGZ7_9SPIO|nr:DUF4080 domain-containing protein [Spirochaeta isovalerica]MBB6482477.1 hypothetical protein [Spirochaeta isovalerica]
MKKIILAAINSRSSHSNPTLFAIRQMLKKEKDLQTVLIELTINENWRDALAKLASQNGTLYLFSVYIWNREYIEKMIPLLKAILPDAKMILGGPEISHNIAYWEDKTWADILVSGQAEDFIPHLLTYREKVYYSAHTPINNVPFPYDKNDREILNGRLVYYEASRGCLFNCSYCLSACRQERPEYRNIETVKKEMRKLIDLNPRIVKMVDRTFNSDRTYAREIWDFLIKLNPPVPFHFEIHPVFLEDEDFNILAKAPEGLFFFEVGIQSTDKDVLKAVDRPWNRSGEKENIDRLCSLKNIHTHLDQIVALPLDTPQKARHSFNEILNHRPDDFQLGFLKILPGTPLAARAGEFGLVSTPFPPYEVVKTSSFSFDDIQRFYRTEADLNRYYNSGYFPGTVGFLMSRFADPWTFFEELGSYSPENPLAKQWPVLAESLFLLSLKHFPDDREYLIDLLRYDWCPHASGQSYPPLIRLEVDNRIKDIRREAYNLFENEINGFTRRSFNHSILFVPVSSRMKKEHSDEITLFYREESTPTPVRMKLDRPSIFSRDLT